MKIRNTGRIIGPDPLSSPARVERVADAKAVESVQPIQDRISVLEIPPEEVTPKVRTAIMKLLREVDVLRKEVESKQRRLLELERLADMDPLAPIANRRAFVREISRVISYSERYGVEASLLFFDVNDMKTVNDKYGHSVGDAVLVHVANTLTANVRESDTVGRLGGDEFAVLLVQANEEMAIAKGSQLARLLADTPLRHEGIEIKVRAAFGAYTFGAHEKPTDIIDQADRRMYEHKRSLKRQQDAPPETAKKA